MAVEAGNCLGRCEFLQAEPMAKTRGSLKRSMFMTTH